MSTKRKPKRHVILISQRARELLNREVARIQKEVGGQPSGAMIADRIIIEALERKDGDE